MTRLTFEPSLDNKTYVVYDKKQSVALIQKIMRNYYLTRVDVLLDSVDLRGIIKKLDELNDSKY